MDYDINIASSTVVTMVTHFLFSSPHLSAKRGLVYPN